MDNDSGDSHHPVLGALAVLVLGVIGGAVAWAGRSLQTWTGPLTVAGSAAVLAAVVVLGLRWWHRAGPRWRPRLRAVRTALARLRTFVADHSDLVRVGLGLVLLTGLVVVDRTAELLGSGTGGLQLVVVAVGLAGVAWLGYRWWRRSRRIPARTKRELQALDPADFERRVAQWLRADGYRWVQVEGGPGDLQADVTATSPDGAFVVVQCKRYTEGHPVGSPDIQSFAGMVHLEHRADRGLFVTTSRFTAPARELAARHDIGLIDGDELARRLQAQAGGAPEVAPTTRPAGPAPGASENSGAGGSHPAIGHLGPWSPRHPLWQDQTTTSAGEDDPDGNEVAEELRRLVQLRAEGLLSDKELEARKQWLLRR